MRGRNGRWDSRLVAINQGGWAKRHPPIFVRRRNTLRYCALRALTFIAISPFYADDGTITGIIDASPERPLRVTITSDNKLTISPP